MEPGTLLAERYLLRDRLAAGGMGEVWRARDTVLAREVAVKLLGAMTTADDAALQRFRREAEAMAALQHPNIVTIFDVGTHAGAPFIVMELLAGPTVEQIVRDRGALGEPEAARLATQVAAGLAAAHQAGVVHRDIKPGNLMLSTSGDLKVVDFGIARLAHGSGLTATNSVLGSAAYLSPEQASGAPADERSDLYALGCVLTTMLTGHPPFAGEHPLSVMQQHVASAPPALRDRRPAISLAMEALVHRLLAKDPSDRPSSASEVRDELSTLSSPAVPETATVPLPRPEATQPMPVSAEPSHTVPLPTGAPPRGSSEPGHPATYPPPTRGAARRWVVPAILAALALAAVVAIGTQMIAPDRGTVGGGDQSSAESTATAPSESPADPPPSPPTSAPAPADPDDEPGPESTGSGLDEARRVIDDAAADGSLLPKKAEELHKRLDDLEKKLQEGDGDVDKQVREITRQLDELVKKGELQPAAARRIEEALNSI